MVLRPYGGDWGLYIGFGWPGLKRIGVKISEVLKLYMLKKWFNIVPTVEYLKMGRGLWLVCTDFGEGRTGKIASDQAHPAFVQLNIYYFP